MRRARSVPLVSVLCVAALLFPACGDDDDAATPDAGGPRDWQGQTIPTSTVPEAGIRRELFRVPGATPPANPETGDATPSEYNFTQVVRYRQDVTPPAAARAIVIAYPGLIAGGPSWEMLARHLVRGSVAAGEPIEVWGIDRRANLLEDLRGLDTAEAAGNPEIAQGYYFGLDTIDGVPFSGMRSHPDLAFMSEWGLATHIEDLGHVIDLIPEESRLGHLFLLGHSMGGWFAEAFGAWRFADGSRGAEELAGIIMIDGVLHEQPLTEEEYLGGTTGGFLSYAGLDKLRSGNRAYFEIPFLGPYALPQVEILLMRALVDPDGIIADEERDRTLRLLLQMGGDPIPTMTNAAAAGFAFDDESTSVFLFAVSCGKSAGGGVEEYHNVIADEDLIRPTDPEATYTWVNATATDPDEFTPMENLARAFVDGASNFVEWYYPERLRIDLAASGGANIPEDGYGAANGLRVFDGLLDDAPILAIAGGLVDPEEFEPVRTRVAATIGEGRPHAGLTRDDPLAFRILDATHFTHIDPITAAEREGNEIPGAVLDFVMAHAQSGTVTIPQQD